MLWMSVGFNLPHHTNHFRTVPTEKDCIVNEFYLYIEWTEIQYLLFHLSPFLLPSIPFNYYPSFVSTFLYPLLPPLLCSSSTTLPSSIHHITPLLIFTWPCQQGVPTLLWVTSDNAGIGFQSGFETAICSWPDNTLAPVSPQGVCYLSSYWSPEHLLCSLWFCSNPSPN